jgi:hypothetical protein
MYYCMCLDWAFLEVWNTIFQYEDVSKLGGVQGPSVGVQTVQWVLEDYLKTW